uniref:Uncharacterized protein n=1 Tax=Amphimedon queenslandica TaxID=400682 RepID=A0A1X7TSZ6_AMPQE
MEFASIINTDASIDIYALGRSGPWSLTRGPYFSLFGSLGRVHKLVCIGSGRTYQRLTVEETMADNEGVLGHSETDETETLRDPGTGSSGDNPRTETTTRKDTTQAADGSMRMMLQM